MKSSKRDSILSLIKTNVFLLKPPLLKKSEGALQKFLDKLEQAICEIDVISQLKIQNGT